MKHRFALSCFLVLTILGHLTAHAQFVCPCLSDEAGNKPQKVFSFSNGRRIGLCGERSSLQGVEVYTGCTIYPCGQHKAMGEWDATESCSVIQKGDTLEVAEWYPIANGRHLSLEWHPFYIIQYHWGHGRWMQASWFDRHLRTYTVQEIKQVAGQYAALAKPRNYDHLLLVAHRLFWAYVSGSRQAGKDLETCYKRFGPFDGAVSEEFDAVMAAYRYYREMEGRRH